MILAFDLFGSRFGVLERSIYRDALSRVYIPGQRHIEVNRDVIFHEEALFRKTLELSTKDEVSPLEFPYSEIKREKRNLKIKFQMPLTLKVHQKSCLKFLLPKEDLLSTERRYKKARSIKLLPGLLEKA